MSPDFCIAVKARKGLRLERTMNPKAVKLLRIAGNALFLAADGRHSIEIKLKPKC
jgi:hypothetical protein